jgi:hypothetical protein
MNRHRLFIGFILFQSLVLGGLMLAGRASVAASERSELPERQALVRALGLTDLALWGEARYTRHPSQADLFTPFQGFPGAPEHFPAGSIVGPPAVRAATTLTFR